MQQWCGCVGWAGTSAKGIAAVQEAMGNWLRRCIAFEGFHSVTRSLHVRVASHLCQQRHTAPHASLVRLQTAQHNQGALVGNSNCQANAAFQGLKGCGIHHQHASKGLPPPPPPTRSPHVHTAVCGPKAAGQARKGHEFHAASRKISRCTRRAQYANSHGRECTFCFATAN